MNEPRCELLSAPDGGRCHNQASGTWWATPPRPVLLCDDCRRGLEDQPAGITEPWEPLHPHPVQAAIERRLAATAAGYFG